MYSSATAIVLMTILKHDALFLFEWQFTIGTAYTQTNKLYFEKYHNV